MIPCTTGIYSQPDSNIQHDSVIDKKARLESGVGSRLQRILKAREYKYLSKELYIVVKVNFGLP